MATPYFFLAHILTLSPVHESPVTAFLPLTDDGNGFTSRSSRAFDPLEFQGPSTMTPGLAV